MSPFRSRPRSAQFLCPPTFAALLGVLLFATPSQGEEEHLPVPFTAEQLRDAWYEGFWLVTETETGTGDEATFRVVRTTVVEWGDEEVAMVETLETGAEPTAEELEAARRVTLAWEVLEGHGRFPAENTRRSRDRRETPLGDLEGWTYEVSNEDGTLSSFFFADCCPGPPVVYGSRIGDQQVYRAVQTARAPARD